MPCLGGLCLLLLVLYQQPYKGTDMADAFVLRFAQLLSLLLCQGTVDALFFSFPVTCTRVRSSFLGEKCFRQIP